MRRTHVLLRVSSADAPAGPLSRELARAVDRYACDRGRFHVRCRPVDAGGLPVPRCADEHAVRRRAGRPLRVDDAAVRRARVRARRGGKRRVGRRRRRSSRRPATISRHFLRVARWSIVASIASGVAWLVVAAASMSGLPVADALDRDTLALVLAETTFGHAWMCARRSCRRALRAALRAREIATASRPRSWRHAGDARIAAAYLAALAWSGHAAAGDGFDGDIEIVADVVHLLAAGAWLGALPAFVFLLRARAGARGSRSGDAALFDAGRGVRCVAGGKRRRERLVSRRRCAGARSARAMAGSCSPSSRSSRRCWSSRSPIAGISPCGWRKGTRDAPRLIRRNAIAEIVAGIGVVAIVGVLGVTPPAIHETPVWPFAHTLSFARAEQSAWLQMALAAAGLLACVAVGVALAGLRRRRPRQWLGGRRGHRGARRDLRPVARGARVSQHLLVVADPLHDGRHRQRLGALRVELPRTVTGSIDLTARSTRPRAVRRAPTDPIDHALRHTDGEHYWWIAHGIPGTSMPGFASRLTDDGYLGPDRVSQCASRGARRRRR